MKDSSNQTKEKSAYPLLSCYEQDYYLWLDQTAMQIDINQQQITNNK